LVEVEIRTFKEVDLKGGTVIAALPSFGFVSTIVASYLISMLDSDQLCALESEEFPPISMVYAQKPKFPARVYELRGSRVAVFVCEMPVPKGTQRAIARTLIKWARTHDIARIVSLEGLPSEKGSEEPMTGDPKVWGGRQHGPGPSRTFQTWNRPATLRSNIRCNWCSSERRTLAKL
jgi:predicted ATP-grasp superfamily ATP-dependent carboligase